MYIVKTRQGLNWRIRRDIKRHRLTEVSCMWRGIGKSEQLIMIAIETNATIVCRSFMERDRCRKRYPKQIKFIAYLELSYMFRDDLLLLEEGIPLSELKNIIRRYQVLGGYINTPLNYIESKTQLRSYLGMKF
jgi:hypothetical protein